MLKRTISISRWRGGGNGGDGGGGGEEKKTIISTPWISLGMKRKAELERSQISTSCSPHRVTSGQRGKKRRKGCRNTWMRKGYSWNGRQNKATPCRSFLTDQTDLEFTPTRV